MSNNLRVANARNRRRLITLSWITALTVLTIALIYWEKTAILYILATLGLSALLVVVALADLHGRDNTTVEAVDESRKS